MAFTNFPNGLTSFGAPVNGLFTNGVPLFVKPGTDSGGSDGYPGDSMETPLATLSKAQDLATADRNDVVYMIASSNTAANTTDYQSVALDWAKDAVHLVGVNAGPLVSQRSRIAQLSTATDVDNLFTVSADGCYISGIEVFHGVNNAASKGAVLVSGSRNHFVNCHFAGIGHDTMDTVDNYSLSVTGSENLFENCVIGLDTIARGTAVNYELTLSGGATRNTFKNCMFITYAEANTHLFMKVAANGVDRWTLFENCSFINMPTGIASGTTMTEAFDITGGGSPDGLFLLRNCTLVGATDWEANTESARVYIDSAVSANNVSGLAVLIEAT
jgi:hypothetical protein